MVHPRGAHQKRREVVRAHRTGVIASRSELLSLHCPRHLLLLALLPACAGSQVIMRQDCSAYAAEPLRTAGLLEAAHQYSLQDVCRSARTPSPLHSLLRRDSSKNLTGTLFSLTPQMAYSAAAAMQTQKFPCAWAPLSSCEASQQCYPEGCAAPG
jgi:hypothetical protein